MPAEIKPPGFQVQSYGSMANFFHSAIDPDMFIHFDRFFKDDLIYFKGDHPWGAADCTSHGATGFIQPGKHSAPEQVIVDANITGLTDFCGDDLHEEGQLMLFQFFKVKHQGQQVFYAIDNLHLPMAIPHDDADGCPVPVLIG